MLTVTAPHVLPAWSVIPVVPQLQKLVVVLWTSLVVFFILAILPSLSMPLHLCSVSDRSCAIADGPKNNASTRIELARRIYCFVGQHAYSRDCLTPFAQVG